MKIISDDIVKLEKLYNLLDEEGIVVEKESKDEEGKAFLDFIIQVTPNVQMQIHITLLQIMGAIGFVYGVGKKILIKKPSGEEEIIDAEIIENPKLIEHKKKIEALDIPIDSVLEII